MLILKKLTQKYNLLENELSNPVSKVREKILKKRLIHGERLPLLKSKSKKLKARVEKYDPNCATCSYLRLLINVPFTRLKIKEMYQSEFGLQHSFVDKKKHIKKHLTLNLESLADKITDNLESSKRIVACICRYFDPIQDGLFRGCSRMARGGGQKGPPSLKSVTHIQQRSKFAQLYLT